LRQLRVPRRPAHLVRPRALRASAAAVLAITAALLFGPAPAALAADKTLVSGQGGWFWSSNNKNTVCTGSGGGVIPAERRACTGVSIDDGANAQGIGATPSGALSPISTGHIGVSLKDGSSDMRGYLKFDLGTLTATLPLGSTLRFTSFVVVLTTAVPDDTEHAQQHTSFDQGKPPATSNERSATVLACAVTEPWGTAEGDPPASTEILAPDPAADPPRESYEIKTTRDEPLYDCGEQAIIGKPTTDFRGWRFDITPLANKWASNQLENNGIALVPGNDSLVSTWTVEFHGPPLEIKKDDAKVTVVDGAHAARADVSYDEVPFELPPTQGPAGPAGAPGTPGTTVIPPGSVPPEDTTPDQGAGQTGPLVPVARSGAPTTPGWLYGLIPLGLMGLALTSRVIGPEAVAAGADNRVARSLRARRINGDVANDAELSNP